MNYYSQYKQDFIVDNLFNHKKNGVFIDIGAHNGVIFSNSYFLEKERNWTGLCIEPNPEFYSELEENRNCHTVSGCISDREGVMTFCKITGQHNMLSGLKDNISPRHLERIKRDMDAHGGEIVEIDMNCYVLNDLLEKHNMYDIDYCSIDTEGAELDILRSIDFDRFNIKVFSVENDDISQEIRSIMKSKGYILLCFAGVDEIYIKKGQVETSKFLLQQSIKGHIKKNRITTQLRLMKRSMFN